MCLVYFHGSWRIECCSSRGKSLFTNRSPSPSASKLLLSNFTFSLVSFTSVALTLGVALGITVVAWVRSRGRCNRLI